MIEKENDEEWLLVLQSEQEAPEVDENESLTNVMASLDDNAPDEEWWFWRWWYHLEWRLRMFVLM